MADRDFDAEIQLLTEQIKTLSDTVSANLVLEGAIGKDIDVLTASLGQPEIALDPKAFKKVNEQIDAAISKRQTVARSMTGLTEAISKLETQRRNVNAAKHTQAGLDFGRSAVLTARSIDDEILPDLKDALRKLVDYGHATAVNMSHAHPSQVWDVKPLVAMTLARICRGCGIPVVPHPDISSGRANSDGHESFMDALAEFASILETTRV
jgi:hypothetical protein